MNEEKRPACPNCKEEKVQKNGRIHNGKQRYKCTRCSYQYTPEGAKKTVESEVRAQVDLLLLENISLRGICRVLRVSMTWLLGYIERKKAKENHMPEVSLEGKQARVVVCDEMWSLVKGLAVWLWFALDAATGEVLALVFGDRSKKTARRLWNALPSFVPKKALFYTDGLASYHDVLPWRRHKVVSKKSGLLNPMNVLHSALRQRLRRLARKTVAHSKSLSSHKAFVHFFLRQRQASLLR